VNYLYRTSNGVEEIPIEHPENVIYHLSEQECDAVSVRGPCVASLPAFLYVLDKAYPEWS